MIRPPVANRAAQREPVKARNHQIEHQQIEAIALGAFQRLLSVADAFARVAFQPEMQAHELADVRLVLDDQHPRMRGLGHDFFIIRSL